MNKVVVPLAALVAVGLVGCGSSSGSAGKPASGASVGVRPTPAAAVLNGEQSKSPQQVLKDAKSALFNAPAVHVLGTVSMDGETETVNLQFQGVDTSGTLTVSGVTVNIVKTAGKVYVKAPERFWAKSVGSAVAPKLANRWLVQDAAKATDVSSITLQGIAASLNAEDSPLKPAVTPGNVDGKKAVLVTQQDGSQLAVANTGKPLPLKVTGDRSTKGSLRFTNYGQNQVITAPPGAITAQAAVHAPTTGAA